MARLKEPRKIELMHNDDARCYYCRRVTILTRKSPKWDGLTATLDHITPRASGGGRVENLVLACRDCNDLKGDLTPQEFAAAVAFAAGNDFKPEKTRGQFFKPLRNWASLREFFAE